MKIAYINYFPKYFVGNHSRLDAMATAADELGLSDMDFFLLSPNDSKSVNNLTLVDCRTFPLFSKYIDLYHRYRLIEKSIDLNIYDRIILRYPGADASGLPFVRKYNVVTEHHTKELPEHQALLKSELTLPVRALKHLRIRLHEKYHSAILENVKGIIGVTKDISEYEARLSSRQIPKRRIPNGISTANITHTKFLSYNGRILNMAFMASEKAPWHGLDRILTSLEHYKGSTIINLHLIGSMRQSDATLGDNVNVVYHGHKSGSVLDTLMSQMNVAMSSMALFKNHMVEGSCLKTREYTARGLPFIIGHSDYDLRFVDDDKKFFVEFPNDCSLVDFEKVIDFAHGLSKRRNEIADYMRIYAYEHMDWKCKIEQYIF